MSWIEWAAAVITLVSVILSAIENIWSWPTAIIGVGIYVYVFWSVQLYADMGLQFVYIAISIYGWYHWLYGGARHSELRVSRASPLANILSTAIATLFAFALGAFLQKMTDASLPYADASLSAFSLLAQWQMTRKYLLNWIIWIIVDVFYVAMFIVKELYVTAGLYVVFIGVCTMGFIEWRRSMTNKLATP